ncbi:MAG TPA: hypothetical protein VIR30_06545 [Nocardioides sp.]
MSTTSPTIGLFRDLVDLPFRLLGLERAPRALTAPLTRSAPSSAPVLFRSAGHQVALDPDSVEQAFPHATDRLVLFVPDGDDDESCWAEHLDQVGGTYPSRLASLLDWTPVHMLVAPGPRPAELAVDVVSSVQALVGAWPVDVRRIALVGHGSGGLVLRAAVAVEAFGGESWLDLVSDMVLLGTPHLAVPASGTNLSRRVEEEWAGITTEDVADPHIPALSGVRYAVVTGKHRMSESRLGGLVGDLLWWRRRLPTRPRKARDLFPTASLHHVETGQLSLRNHPDVHQAMLGWLA